MQLIGPRLDGMKADDGRDRLPWPNDDNYATTGSCPTSTLDVLFGAQGFFKTNRLARGVKYDNPSQTGIDKPVEKACPSSASIKAFAVTWKASFFSFSFSLCPWDRFSTMSNALCVLWWIAISPWPRQSYWGPICLSIVSKAALDTAPLVVGLSIVEVGWEKWLLRAWIRWRCTLKYLIDGGWQSDAFFWSIFP